MNLSTRVAQVPDLSAFSALRHLELSYNAIHSLAPLKACGATRLEELYAASNKIAEVRWHRAGSSCSRSTPACF